MKSESKTESTNEITITCPNCDAEVPLSEAVAHRFREQFQADFDFKRKQQEKLFAQRERELRDKQEEIDAAEKQFNDRVKATVDQQKAKLLADAKASAQATFAVEIKDLKSQLDEKKRSLDEAQTKELEWRRRERALQDKQKALELEVERRLAEERSKIREAARQQVTDEQKLRFAEKDKVIADLRTQIGVLKQRAEQGSQQLQGEVLELEIEAVLKAQFPHDEISSVATGTRGSDLMQKVRTPSGIECGIIIWESKRTRNWSESWIAKIKDNQRANGADIGIIVTQALPKDLKCFGCLDGVWVSDLNSYIGLSFALRHGLFLAAHERQVAAGKSGKKEELYRYLSGLEFRQRVEALAEAFRDLRADLETEKRAMAKIWAAREKQITRAIESTAGIFGDVQGIIGKSALPEIKVLQLGA